MVGGQADVGEAEGLLVNGGWSCAFTVLFEVGDGVFAGGEVLVGEQDGSIADSDLVAVSEFGFAGDFSVVEECAVLAV